MRRRSMPHRGALRADAAGLLVVMVVAGWALMTWVQHGNASSLLHPAQDWSSSAESLTQLSGIVATLLALSGVVLAARPRGLDALYGLDRVLVWHRNVGVAMAFTVAVHVVVSLVAWAHFGGIAHALAELTGRTQYMALAAVGAAGIAVVAVSSMRSLRRRIGYETWYFLHLTVYASLVAAFFHQIYVGVDFASGFARWAWIALHLVVAATVLVSRWGRLLRAMLHPLRVVEVRPAGNSTRVLTLKGRVPAHAGAGQFVLARALRPGMWWHANPFSLSAAPRDSFLRLTIRARGEASAAFAELPHGTRVVVEGPYGSTTSDQLAGTKLLFIAGGVGVSQVRALLEELDRDAQPVVLYRARTESDLVHLDELTDLCTRLGGAVLTLVGPSSSLGTDPFSAESLLRAAPDLVSRVAVVCGPESLVRSAYHGLRGAGMAPWQIHYERVWW